MSAVITPTTPNPVFVKTLPVIDQSLIYAVAAPSIVVYTGSNSLSLVLNPEIEGSGTTASLKIVAGGINETIYDNSFTLTNLHVSGSVYGGVIASTGLRTTAIAASRLATKYISTDLGLNIGNTSVTIQNGTYSNVFGGGAGYGSRVTGDTTVNWSGNTVGSIFGGGDVGSVVDGSTNVNINGNATGYGNYYGYTNGGRISNIYGGGRNSTVKGDANVTFSTDAALINFAGTVYGAGLGVNSIVKGDRNLIYEDYTGAFKANIIGFNHISFEGSSSVTMTRAQNASIKLATYEFVINDKTLLNQNAMLVWDMANVQINKVIVNISSDPVPVDGNGGAMLDQGAEIKLIHSKYFVLNNSFNVNNVLVLNDEGDKVSSVVFDVIYEKYDKKTKLGGDVSIDYKGTSIVLDGRETVKVVLTGRSEEVSIIEGAFLSFGLNTAGGDDVVNVQNGAIVNGTLSLGADDDTLCIQAGSLLNGCIDLGSGDDHMVVAAAATVNCDVALGAGANDLTVQNNAMISGTIRLSDGTINELVTNDITINGGAVANFEGGNAYTTDNIVVTGSRFLMPLLGGEIVVGGGIGYYQNLLPNSLDIAGTINGDPLNLTLTLDQQNWILANVFVAQDLNLGASNDNVTFNSYAQVLNINLGAGDDTLVLNENAIIDGDINLGSGENALVINCGYVFDGRLIDNSTTNGTVVVFAGASMELDGDKLGFGSTNNVLVVSEGSNVELEGSSIGSFLSEDNYGIYLNQNAIISFDDFYHHTEYMQNYTGTLTVEGDLMVFAAPASYPEQVANYYDGHTGGVVNSELLVEGSFILDTGAKVANSLLSVEADAIIDGAISGSTLMVGGNAFVDGTFAGGMLIVEGDVEVVQIAGLSGDTLTQFVETFENGDLVVGGGITGTIIDVDGNAFIELGATVSNSTINVDGTVLREWTEDVNGFVVDVDYDLVAGDMIIDGTVSGSNINVADAAIIRGSVLGSTLTAEEIIFDAEGVSVAGSTLTAEEVEFNYNFSDAALVIGTEEIELEDNIVVTVGSFYNPDIDGFDIDYNIGDNSMLIEAIPETITIGDYYSETSPLVFTDGYNVSIRGLVFVDMWFTNNDISLDEGEYVYGDFYGVAHMSGDNTLTVNDNRFYDWQQFDLAVDATLGFKIADYTLLAIDGFVDVDPITAIVNPTEFGQNSQLAIGSWVYIHDWKDTFEATRSYELPILGLAPYDWEGRVDNLAWNDLYVKSSLLDGAQIWGGIRLNDRANQLVINDGAVVNGSTSYYDFATIRTLDGDDTITIGAATINGRIDAGDDDDILTLNGTTINAAINQDAASIQMGEGDDELNINAGTVVNGNINLGSGNDEAGITGAIVNGMIDLGWGNGYDDLSITNSEVGITATAENDDAILGGEGDNDVEILASFVKGDIELNGESNKLFVLAGTTLTGFTATSPSLVLGDIELAEGENLVVVDKSTVLGKITLGDGENAVIIDSSLVSGEITLGEGTDGLENFAGITGSILGGDLEFGAVGITAAVTLIEDDVHSEYDGIGSMALITNSTGKDIIFEDVNVDSNLTSDDSLSVGNAAVLGGSTMGNIIFDDVSVNFLDNSAISGNDLTIGNLAEISASTVGNIIFGDVTITGLTGVSGGYEGSEVTVTMEDGSIAFGNMAEIVGSTVNGSVIFEDVSIGNAEGTSDLDFITDLTGDTTIDVGNIAVLEDSTISGDLIFDDVNVMWGLGIPDDIVFNHLGNYAEITGDVTVGSGLTGGDIVMDIAGTEYELGLHEQYGYGNVIQLTETANLTVVGDILMSGINNISTLEYDTEEVANVDAGTIVNSLTAQEISMIGLDNYIGFGVEGEADSEYSHGVSADFYRPTTLQFAAITMALTAPIIMVNDVANAGGENELDMALSLEAEGYGNITISGLVAITANSDISMIGEDNEIEFGVDVLAINTDSHDLELFGNSSITLNNVAMTLNTTEISMLNNGSVYAQNSIEMAYDLAALGKSDITVGSVDISLLDDSAVAPEAAMIAMIGEDNLMDFDIGVAAVNHNNTDFEQLAGMAEVTIGAVNMTLNADIVMLNDVIGQGARNEVDVDFELEARGNSSIVAGPVSVNFDGSVMMVGDRNDIIYGIDAYADGEYLNTGTTLANNLYADSSITLGTVSMQYNAPISMSNNVLGKGADNYLDADYHLSAGAKSNISALGAVDIDLIGGISMIGTTNSLYFDFGAQVDGAISTGVTMTDFHKQSLIELGAISMGISGDINMINDISDTDDTVVNRLDMDYSLGATGEGDIDVYGDGFIGITGDVNMLGNDNVLSAEIVFVAGYQSVIDLNGYDVNLLINGDVTMMTIGDATNTISLGYIRDPLIPDVPLDPEQGVIGATGTYDVEVTGGILMAGIGATNTMTIERNVTIGGGITMGIVIGDQLSAFNSLTVEDPGTFSFAGAIVLTAEANEVTFNGTGDVTGWVSIYGGENTLYVGRGVTLNDIVSFGGIYDADKIGTEGYQILANTENTIDVYGYVKGIDTSKDNVTGTNNSSDDTISIFGNIGTVGTAGITTGNGNDNVDLHGGWVLGNVVMGDRASGASGTNNLFVDGDELGATLGGSALVLGNVSMETTSTNHLDMEGWVGVTLTSMEAPETVYGAYILGNVTMNALGYTGTDEDILDVTVGTNDLDLGDGFRNGGTTIMGDVSMNAGLSNAVTVDTGWYYEFDMAGASMTGATYNASSYVKSLDMAATTNIIDVDHGTFVVGATAGNGISMIQDQADREDDGGTNSIKVEEEARLIVTGDVLMGNTMDNVITVGTYAYVDVTTGATGIETYHFDWSGANVGVTFDTVSNTIGVDGKMYASDIVMTGSVNSIGVTGPAYQPDIVTGATLTAAIMDVDTITMNGWANTIQVAGVTHGDAIFDSGNILMRWGGTTLGDSLSATTNVIQNGTLIDNGKTLFRSGSVQMYASNTNALAVFGLMNEDGSVNTKSTVTGGVTMMAVATAVTDAGWNVARFEDVDVTGNVVMGALGLSGANELDLIGTFLGGTYADVESNITGDVTMQTLVGLTGDNEATIIYGNVGGHINMLAAGFGANDLYIEGATTTSDIGHGIGMDSTFENNELDLIHATVGAISADGITMAAGTNNWAKITASTVNGSISQAAGTWNFLGIDPSTVTGNVSMDSALGGNVGTTFVTPFGNVTDVGNVLVLTGETAGTGITGNVDVTLSRIGGNVTMDANSEKVAGATAWNGLLVDMGGITGSVSMTSVVGVTGGNYLELSGATGLIGGGITGTIVESFIGGLNMSTSGITAGATGGLNAAFIHLANVNGNISMNAAGGTYAFNYLEAYGGVDGSGVTYRSDISGGVSMTSVVSNTLDLDKATVGAGITMTTNGSNEIDMLDSWITSGGIYQSAVTDNLIDITDSAITGGIYQSAGTSNTLNIDPSTVNGNIGMNAADGNYFFLDDSSVIGNVTMVANLSGNTFGMFDSGITGGVTMTSVTGNNEFGFGTIAPIPTGATGLSHITGDIYMLSGITGGVAGGNTMGQFGTLGGGVVMGATADGNNVFGIGGTVSSGVTLTSTIADGVVMTTVTGENTLVVFDYANISGGVTMMTAGTTGHNDLRVNATSGITGGVVTGASHDDFWILGTVGGGINSGAGDDDLAVYGGGIVHGTVNMGAGANAINLENSVLGVGTTFAFDTINTSGATGWVDVFGTAAVENMFISSGFGSAGSTMTVDANVDTMTFVGVSGTSIGIAGALDTSAVAGGNALDARGLTGGNTLIAASGTTTWDIMDTDVGTDLDILANAGTANLQSISLVTGVSMNLDTWTRSGAALTLSLSDGVSGQFLWTGAQYETGVLANGENWALDDNGASKNALILTRIA